MPKHGNKYDLIHFITVYIQMANQMGQLGTWQSILPASTGSGLQKVPGYPQQEGLLPNTTTTDRIFNAINWASVTASCVSVVKLKHQNTSSFIVHRTNNAENVCSWSYQSNSDWTSSTLIPYSAIKITQNYQTGEKLSDGRLLPTSRPQADSERRSLMTSLTALIHNPHLLSQSKYELSYHRQKTHTSEASCTVETTWAAQAVDCGQILCMKKKKLCRG